MVINDFNVCEVVAAGREANAVLIVDSNAVLPLAVALELLQAIPRRNSQILHTSCIVDQDQLSQRDSLNGLRQFLGKGLMIDLFRFCVSKALYHALIIHAVRVYVKRVYQKEATSIYIYPENMKAKATLWLWELRDVAIIAVALLLSVFALAQTGSAALLVGTVLFAFLSIRVEDNSVLSFLCFATRFLFLQQQYFEWEEPHE